MAQKGGWMAQELERIQVSESEAHNAARTDNEKGDSSEKRRRKITHGVE
jgi:hypothetical protein